jgi:hypothetical protein
VRYAEAGCDLADGLAGCEEQLDLGSGDDPFPNRLGEDLLELSRFGFWLGQFRLGFQGLGTSRPGGCLSNRRNGAPAGLVDQPCRHVPRLRPNLSGSLPGSSDEFGVQIGGSECVPVGQTATHTHESGQQQPQEQLRRSLITVTGLGAQGGKSGVLPSVGLGVWVAQEDNEGFRVAK